MVSGRLVFSPMRHETARGRLAVTITEVVRRFEELVRVAASALPSTAEEMLTFEQSLHESVARECLDPFVGSAVRVGLESEAVIERGAAIVAAYPSLRSQKTNQEVRISLLGGTVFTVETPYYLERAEGPTKRRRGQRAPAQGNGLYPALSALGIQYRATPALASDVARLVAQGTLQQTVDTLSLRGVEFDVKGVSRLAQRLAERGLQYRDYLMERTKAGGWRGQTAKGRRLVMGIDGGRLRCRYTKSGRRRKSGWHGYDPQWREPKVLVIYEVDEKGRKVKKGLLRYDATLKDADGLFEILTAMLIDLGAHEALYWAIVADGASWIWDRISKLIQDVGFSQDRVVQVLDFFHACEHVHEFASKIQGWTETRQKKWAREMGRLLRKGRFDSFLREATNLCTGHDADLLDSLEYFVNRRHLMDYIRCDRLGVPVGSGAVESAVRRIVNLRLKGNGITWLEGNAEGILHLRTQLLAGQWRVFVTCPGRRGALAHGRIARRREREGGLNSMKNGMLPRRCTSAREIGPTGWPDDIRKAVL